MYNFVNSVCLSRSIGSQWHEVDLSNILVFDIYTTYSKVYLILSNPSLPDNVYVDFDTQFQEFSSYQGTLNQWLMDLGNRTLPTVDVLPSTSVKVAKYSDAIRSGYKVQLTKIGVVTPDNYPASELQDLVITRPEHKTDMGLIHSHCLVSVNGFYHRTDTDAHKAFVYRGGDTGRRSHINHVGILSFLDIGALTKVPIDPTRIYTQSAPGVPSTLKDRIYFDIDQDLTNKSVILVLGGYLVFPEQGTFWQSGDHTLALDINQIPYAQRIYESQRYLDLSGLGLTHFPLSKDAIDVDELYSDDVLKRYLTLSQSFLVIVDTSNLITNKIHLRHSHLPGMFTCYQDPVLPLIVSYGKVAEYWKVFEDGYWAVNVEDSFYRNYVLSQQPIYQLKTINGHLLPNQPFWHSQGHLLEILGYHV